MHICFQNTDNNRHSMHSVCTQIIIPKSFQKIIKQNFRRNTMHALGYHSNLVPSQKIPKEIVQKKKFLSH